MVLPGHMYGLEVTVHGPPPGHVDGLEISVHGPPLYPRTCKLSRGQCAWSSPPAPPTPDM